MRPVATVAAILFALIALMQLLRILLGWEIMVNGTNIPLWASGLAFALAAVVAILLWLESRLRTTPR